MKKLLSILAAISMSATAASSVVACGSNSSKQDSDEDVILSSNGIKVTSDALLDQLLNHSEFEKVFGDQGTAAKTFMNYFAEAFEKTIADKAPAISKNNLASLYTNDDTFQSIKKSWETRNSNVNDIWDKKVSDAKSADGKKWESKLFDSLKDTYGEKVYKDGKAVKATSYKDYESKFKSDALLTGTGTSDGSSIFSSLTNDLYGWAKDPKNQSIKDIYNQLRSGLFGKEYKDQNVNFAAAKASGKDVKDGDKRKDSLFGQMDNVLNFINAHPDDATAKGFVNFIVDMYNITGGLNAGTGTQVKGTFNVASIKWATSENIKDKLKDVKNTSNELIERMDTNYEDDFGANAKDGQTATADHLMINSKYDFKDLIDYVPSDSQSDLTGQSTIAGLFSNTQRFVANDYFNVEKPVAVTELVVSPIQSSTIDYAEQITNSGYAGTDIKQTDQLYNFIGNFINNKIGDIKDAKFDDAITSSDKLKTGNPNFTWDDLMGNTSNWTKNVNGNKPWDSAFTGKIKFNAHSNLLTVDSSTSDYSNLLKYSVYNFLAKGGEEYKFTNDKSTPLSNETTIAQIDEVGKNDADLKDLYTPEYNAITNFVQSMNRTSDKSSMYQVVNADQGIISFMDTDGIHFVRIEGYGLLSGDNAAKLNATEQTSLTTANFSKQDDSADKAKAEFTSADALKNALANNTDTISKSAVTVASNWRPATDQENKVGVKYDDLNKNFGNQYLRFLANSSIPKALGYSSPKYEYNLGDLLKSYVTGDITNDSLATSPSMLMMAWNYAKLIFNITDDNKLFDLVIDGSALSKDISNTDWDKEHKDKFVSKYKEYIVQDILGKYNDSDRLNKANSSFENGLEQADKAIDETAWKNTSKNMDALHPSLKWTKVLGGDTPLKSYESEVQALNDKKIWVPDKGKWSPSSTVGLNTVFNYDEVNKNQFVVNDYALKGDED